MEARGKVMLTQGDVADYLAGKPMATEFYEVIRKLGSRDARNSGWDIIKEVYGPNATDGQQASGYQIIRELINAGLIENRSLYGSYDLRIVQVTE